MESPAPSSPGLVVERIDAEATHPLRQSVLRPGRPVEECVFPGDEDEATLHVGALRDGEVVAIASLYLEPRPVDAAGGAERAADHDAGTVWRLRGMATDPSLRRMGAGAAALEACEQHARERGGTLLWCNARVEAIAFYEANGWSVLGDEFDIPTVGPHFVMEKRLA
jgi:GNAT superfamily N-acetyltransferase